jgi:hypothetical protein
VTILENDCCIRLDRRRHAFGDLRGWKCFGWRNATGENDGVVHDPSFFG